VFLGSRREAKIPTLSEHFAVYLLRTSAPYKPAPRSVGDLETAWGWLVALAGPAAATAERKPSGIEQFLLEQDVQPWLAKAIAPISRSVGMRSANDEYRRRDLCEAIRFLASPRRRLSTISNKAKSLVSMLKETSLFWDLYSSGGAAAQEFAWMLRPAADGDMGCCRRVAQLAAILAPLLPTRRGPKTTVPSAAHEYFLKEIVTPLMERRPQPGGGGVNLFNRAAKATREEFKNLDLDFRPSRRRLRRQASAQGHASGSEIGLN
jgi:hypothetical protein